MNKLEDLQDGFTETPLPLIDVTLIDGRLLIHSFLSIIGNIKSYGHLAITFISQECVSQDNEINVLFDTCRPMSLKEREIKLRGADDGPLINSGQNKAP